MFILEGADMIGKTTAADSLALYFWDNYNRHIGRQEFKSADADLLDDNVAAYRNFIKPFSLCDRFHLSEVVYGIICRGHSRLSPADVVDLSHAISLNDGFVLTLTASVEAYTVLVDLFHSRGEQFNRVLCERVNAAYRFLMYPHDDEAARLITRKERRRLTKYARAITAQRHVYFEQRVFMTGETDGTGSVVKMLGQTQIDYFGRLYAVAQHTTRD